MKPASLNEISKWCKGILRSGDGSLAVSSFSKDTRSLKRGDVYLGIRGERFDGNAYIAEAAAAGAAAAITDRGEVPAVPENFGLIEVPDSIAALQAIAAAARAQMALKAVCITGSNGKTSTKDFTAQVLSSQFRTSRTEGNLNNHIGLPFTIVNTDPEMEAAVWEIGMNHPGEIEPLAKLASPDISIITNIGIAHIEYMGSREGTAKEKGMLAEAVHADGLVILNADDEFSDSIAKRTHAHVLKVGLECGDIRASQLVQNDEGCAYVVETPAGRTDVRITVPGVHMVRNSLFAIAAGLHLGISLETCATALAGAKLTGGRLERKTIRGVVFLDDTYNANPDSMEAALLTLEKLPAQGRKIAALGRMGELGNHAEAGYRRVGKAVSQTVNALVTVGSEAAQMAKAAREDGLKEIFEAENATEASQWLRKFAHEGDMILVKGSRSAKMENVIGEFQ